MASASRKRSAILSNDKMGEYVLVSESEESLLDSEFDPDTVLNGCALLDVMVDSDTDEDDDAIRDCVGGYEQLQDTRRICHR
jgi:hypothetical protein